MPYQQKQLQGHPDLPLKLTINSNPNANGRWGTRGNNGYSYGQNGSDGGRGGDGKDAPNLTLSLSHHYNQKGYFVNIANNGVVSWSVPLDPRTLISLSARGGNGGDGGNGGNGANGAPGYNGINATQYKKGTNGGPGGGGGNGGSGGRGGNGGDGGHITVRMPESSPLLMLIDHQNVQVSGGYGGSLGSGGQGGRGGPGGRGGRNYTWTTIQRWEEVERCQRRVYRAEYDDYVYVSEAYTVQKEKTIHHEMPGGYSGASGPNGRYGLNGSRGFNGYNGSYKIFLADTGKTYQSIYDLNWTSYVVPSSPDGIIEPGEQLTFIPTFKNIGPMPTPPKHPVIASLDSSAWVLFDPENEEEIHDSIQAGSTFQLTKGLAYQVKYPKQVAEDCTFSAQGTLLPRAYMSLVNKYFPKVEGKVNFNIRYPVEISVIAGAKAIAYGEQAPVTFWVRNISKHSIGNNTVNGRLLTIHFTQAGVKAARGIVFENRANQNQHSLDTSYTITIPHLKPNESMAISGTLKFTNRSVDPNTQIQFKAHLNLGDINNPTRVTHTIQSRSTALQLAETYQFDAAADVVLVVNSSTPASLIADWKSRMNALGLRLNVWNVSLYGGLDYKHIRKDGGSFWSQMQGKVVAILNNSFATDTIHTKQRSTDYLGTAELFEAARRKNIASCVLGNGYAMSNAIFPKHDHPSTKHNNKAGLLAAIDATAGQVDALSPTQYDHYPIHTRTRFNTRPSSSITRKRATKLKNKIDERHPQLQHHIVNYVEKKKLSSSLLKGTKWQVGYVQSRQGLSNTRAHIASHAYKDNDMNQLQERDIFLTISLLPFSKKLSLIPNILQSSQANFKKNSSILLKAILTDLGNECQAFSKKTWSGSYTKDNIESALTTLQALCRHDFSQIAKDKNGKIFLHLLLGKYKRMVKQLPGFMDKTIRDGIFAKRRDWILSKVCKARVNQLIIDYLGVTRTQFKKEERENKNLWRQWDQQGKLRRKNVMRDCAKPKQFCNANTLFSTHRSPAVQKASTIESPKDNSSDIKEARYKFTGSNASNKREKAISKFEEKANFDSDVPLSPDVKKSYFN